MPQPDKQESGGEQFEVAVPRGAPRGGDRPDVAGQTPQDAEMRRRRIVIAVFVAAIVVLALWLGSGSVMNDEGSYEWCAQQGLDRAGCDVINELADELGGSPSDVLHTLDNNLAPID